MRTFESHKIYCPYCEEWLVPVNLSEVVNGKDPDAAFVYQHKDRPHPEDMEWDEIRASKNIQ